MSENGQSFPVGSKVRVRNYHAAGGSTVSFDWNGLEGIVKRADKVGLGLNNKSVYAYEVYFENVDVPYATKDEATQKLVRGSRKQNAQSYFEEIFLERA